MQKKKKKKQQKKNKQKNLRLYWGSSSDVKENLTEFSQISLEILPSLTDFSPQLMACMHKK